MTDSYITVLHRLPEAIREQLAGICPKDTRRVQEIRLFVGGPVTLNVNGTLLGIGEPLTEAELMDCFFSLCGHSVHTYEEQLAEGFFTIEGGHRVGVAGELRYEGQHPAGFKRITGLNLRIARDFFDVLPNRITAFIENGLGNLLIIGPPGSGKTTLLRSIIRRLRQENRRFAVVDSRQELIPVPAGAACYTGTRRDGILYSIRGMNPEFILCDEISTEEDISAIEQAVGAGVRIIASFHGEPGGTLSERMEAIGMKKSLFQEHLFLSGGEMPGRIQEEQS